MVLPEGQDFAWGVKRLKIKKIHCFNMIEVLLALTVIAIGMTSIMGLFPVGLKASRQAVAENSSATVADQMVTYIRVINESDNGTKYNANFIDTADTAYQSTKYSDGDEIASQSKAFLADYKSNDVNKDTGTNYRRIAEGWSIFKTQTTSPTNLQPQMFFVIQGPNSTEDGGNRNIDYSAMVLIWKDIVQIKRLESGGSTWSNWPKDDDIYSDYPTNTVIIPAKAYEYSGKINIELSWPLVLPYSQRKKRYYQVVINKP